MSRKRLVNWRQVEERGNTRRTAWKKKCVLIRTTYAGRGPCLYHDPTSRSSRSFIMTSFWCLRSRGGGCLAASRRPLIPAGSSERSLHIPADTGTQGDKWPARSAAVFGLGLSYASGCYRPAIPCTRDGAC